jgi:galactokinase
MEVGQAARRTFAAAFGRGPLAAARAPGRVNLIGEHTDYNEGLVLPCAIDRDVVAAVAPRRDGRLRVCSRELGERVELELAALARRGHWSDYAAAPCFALAERGLPLPGADLAVASDVPLGAGLSSSAALAVAVLTALDAAFGLGLGARERARLAQRGENAFVGVACGVMDPFASALGRRDTALRIDCRSLAVTPIALPEVRMLVAHSGVERRLAAGAYGDRRAECEAAAAACGVRALRDLPASRLGELEGALRRRARHVVTENARVDAVCRALAAGDPAAAGQRLREGQASLRDDFEVSLPELDALCEIGDAQPGCFGSRLTGAGFGGCTLHLVAAEAADAVARALAEGFARRFGRRPRVHRVRAADGASRLPPA